MNLTKATHHWSPSAADTHMECAQKLYWSKLYGGHGIQSVGRAWELEFGTLMHELALAEPDRGAVELGREAEALTKDLCLKLGIQEPLRTEWPIFAHALIYAFRSRVWPKILEEYEIHKVEGTLRPIQTVHRRLGGGSFKLPWNTRPDLILKHKLTGDLYYWDLKTTGADQEKFCKQWERAVQLHLGAWAFQQVTGEIITACVIQGMHKGHMYKGSLRGPLIVFYRSKALSAVTKVVYRLDSAKGFERGLISEYPEDIEGWVDDLPSEVIAEVFPCTPPINPDGELVGRVLRRTEHIALEIESFQDNLELVLQHVDANTPKVIELLVERYFPRNMKACENPYRNYRCAFYEACWNPTISKAPDESGLYELKTGDPNAEAEEAMNGVE